MGQNIDGFTFDLSLPVKLVTASNKYWKVTLQGKNLKMEVGKIKAGVDTQQDEVNKDYASPVQAKSSMVSKIHEKLVKGYYSSTPLNESKKQNPLKRKTRTSSKIDAVSGGYFQKGKQSTMFQINDSRVRVTRTGANGRSKTEIVDLPSNGQAVQYYEGEQQWLTSQGYVADHSKFNHSFMPDSSSQKTKATVFKSPRPTNKSKDIPKTLSIIRMTDDSMSRTSASKKPIHPSPSKSNVSADDDDDQETFKPSNLGPSTSGPIQVLLAETWNDTFDPTGYYVSEKLDGVRCFWTGTKMFSRQGNQFFPPKFFTKNWPKSQMDGELFINRSRFSETISAIKKKVPIDQQWQKVCYLVFDAPGLKKPFKQRVKIMEEVITEVNNPYLKCHQHRICTGFDDLFQELDAVNKIKGQGLMLRNPDSPYENRRSKNLLKVKTFHDDEATILGFKPGTGRCQGMVGALKVVNTHGIQFDIGSGLNDAMRKKPPKIGTKITYKYQQFIEPSKKPRFPIFLRIYQPL